MSFLHHMQPHRPRLGPAIGSAAAATGRNLVVAAALTMVASVIVSCGSAEPQTNAQLADAVTLNDIGADGAVLDGGVADDGQSGPDSSVPDECAASDECAGGEVCRAGRCREACSGDDPCGEADQVCDEEAGICLDCLADNDCASGEECSEGECVETDPLEPCRPDEIGCLNDATAWACEADGTRTPLPCRDDQQCEEGICRARTTPTPACTAGETRCVGADVQSCEGRPLAFVTVATCGEGTRCEAGICVDEDAPPLVCTPRSGRCVDGAPETCRDDGTGWTPQAACTADEVCVRGECEAPGAIVTGVSASDGTSTSSVSITWEPVAAATGYYVYRDGARITADPVTSPAFVDTGAAPGAPPATLTGVFAVPGPNGVTLGWNAADSTGQAGDASEYAVSAVTAGGEGALSESDSGYRGGYALQAYEVRINGGSWVGAGAFARFNDTSAPAGSITVTNVAASDGTSTAHVALSASVSTTPGATRRYEARAVNPGGPGAPSTSITSQRTVGTLGVLWQRSSGTSATGFADILGANAATYNDTGAPPDGSVRHYRLVAAATGATTVTSASNEGFRQFDGPSPGALGSACTSDAECGEDAWCSSVSGFRRCSPQLFAGQPHELDFVFVPSGTFQQGTTGSSLNDRPFNATLTRDYFVARTEVTQVQWLAASGTNPACFQNTTNTGCSTDNDHADAPVERIDWYAALAYANWASRQEGLQECYTLIDCDSTLAGWQDGEHSGCTGASFAGLDCTGYRLMTESEWERAIRGGTTTVYFWGDTTATDVVESCAWYLSNSDDHTRVVGSRVPNDYGLYDMTGNVWEWLWDWYTTDYPTSSATDYRGRSSGTRRCMRGGSWQNGTTNLRSAGRGSLEPWARNNALGFRLARTVP